MRRLVSRPRDMGVPSRWDANVMVPMALTDIWALGVLLYKLCYYTTPFEESGPLGILNAQHKVSGEIWIDSRR